MVGLHVSIAGSLDLAFDRAQELGATTFQVFTRNPNQWKFKPIPDETVSAFKDKRKKSGFRRLVDHMPYLPNLASPDRATMKISRYSLDEEVKRCDSLGIDYVVVHLGSHLGKGTAVGIANIADACNQAISGSYGLTSILLENMAGQKNSVGARFEEIRAILDKVKDGDRVGVCLDTCLPPGSPVMKDEIPQPIETIQVGDEVTGLGGWPTRVTRLTRRPYLGELVMVKPKGLPWLHLTPEHPLLYAKVDRIKYLEESPWTVKLISEPDWIKADQVSKGNYLLLPTLKGEPVRSLDFRKHVGSNTRRLPFEATLPLSKEMAEFFGLYLAEGYVYIGKGDRGGDLSKIYLSFGKHESDLILRTIQLFERVFSLKAWTDERETSICVAAASNVLARFLRANFGPNARQKRIPRFIMRADAPIIRSFILAYRRGDGSVDETGVSFTTSSTSVAIQLIHVLARLDVHGVHQWHEPTRGKINGRVIEGNGWHTIHVARAEATKLGFDFHIPTIPQRTVLRNSDGFLIPIGAVAKSYFEGEVVNLTTESGTFVAPFVVTHNCHMFASGFDIRNEEAVTNTMGLFSELVGLDQLKTVHLNDSKGPLGSRLDRHENIGDGKIGRKGIKAFLHYPGMGERPIIMETPYEDARTMEKSIKLVRTLMR